MIKTTSIYIVSLKVNEIVFIYNYSQNNFHLSYKEKKDDENSFDKALRKAKEEVDKDIAKYKVYEISRIK